MLERLVSGEGGGGGLITRCILLFTGRWAHKWGEGGLESEVYEMPGAAW